MTRQQVQRVLKRIGLRPQIAAGQNFLLDEEVCREMVEIAEIGPKSVILEVGPGLGVLTKLLLETGAKVIAVELDRRLAQYMRLEYGRHKNFQLLEGDIFKVNLAHHLSDFGYQVVANLPYGVTSLFFRNALTIPPRPTRLTVMLQKEVAERMVAEPGAMSLLSLLVQYHADATFVMTVPKTSFWPAPKVTSAILDVRLKRSEPDPVTTKRVFHLARAAFHGRRKTLHNSLSALPGFDKQAIDAKLASVGISPGARPQELSLQDWLKLAKVII